MADNKVGPLSNGAGVVAESELRRRTLTRQSYTSSALVSRHGSRAVSKAEGDGDEPAADRDQWSGTLDFILSCIGYAVGFGNLTRFPYICGRNGGATFLVPYVIMMVLCGLPMFYLELAIGQYCQVSPLKLYRRMSPILRGLGPTMVLITIFTATYYQIQMAWALQYLFDAIYYACAGELLPWATCTHSWNSNFCYDYDVIHGCEWNTTTWAIDDQGQNITTYEQYYWRGSCLPSFNDTGYLLVDEATIDANHSLTNLMLTNSTVGASPAQEYNDHMLGYNSSYSSEYCLAQWDWPNWEIVVYLFLSWAIMFFMLFNGLKISGKIVYFTALFPYVCLLMLMIIGFTLPHHQDGVEFYFLKPDWTKMKDYQIWVDAASQILFGLSVGGGGLSTLASYNKFENNIYRDTFIVVFGNCATSFFCGWVIFPILGYEANRLYGLSELTSQEAMLKMASTGPTLAFIAYPGALVSLPVAWLWSIIFFFMLLLLGVDSQNVMIEVVTTAVLDYYPTWRHGWRKRTAIAVVCLAGFVGGIILATPSGIELYNLLDTMAGGFTLTLACMVELCMVAWIYDFRRFIADLRLMLGMPPTKFYGWIGYPVNWFWNICWIVITPLLLIMVNVFQFVDFGLTYGPDNKPYGPWGQAVGYGVASIILIWVPIMAVWQTYMAIRKGRGLQWLLRPTPEWGPEHPADRRRQDTEHPYYVNKQPPALEQTISTVVNGKPPPPAGYDGPATHF